MTFAKPKPKAKKSNTPDNQLIVKVPTSKGLVTLGKIGLYDESDLHAKVAALSSEQLIKLISKAELSIVPYESSTEKIELDI